MDFSFKLLIQVYLLSFLCMLMMGSMLMLNVDGWSYFWSGFLAMVGHCARAALVVPVILIVGKILGITT